jgi:hypothetical protein
MGLLVDLDGELVAYRYADETKRSLKRSAKIRAYIVVLVAKIPAELWRGKPRAPCTSSRKSVRTLFPFCHFFVVANSQHSRF